jgi:hypothetical protein
MSPTSRIIASALSLVIVTLLSTMSPMLTLLIADLVRPFLDKIVKASAGLRCQLRQRLL